MILNGELIENKLWENGLDFEFDNEDGIVTLAIMCGGTYLGIQPLWDDGEGGGWFLDVEDISFLTGNLGVLEMYGSSSADTEDALMEEILKIREQII